MNLEDTLPDDVKRELKQAGEKEARRKRREKTKYGHLMGDDR